MDAHDSTGERGSQRRYFDGQGAAIAAAIDMGAFMLALNSGGLANLIWMGLIAIVMVCLIILGLFGLTTHDKTKV